MRMIRVSPFHRQMSRLFNEFAAEGWMPSIDVRETDTEVIVRAEIPGIDPAKVELTVHDNLLTLRGEKSDEAKSDEGHWHRVERRYGSFERNVALPVEVDADQASAEASNGVLTITLAKKAAVARRTIDVQVK